MRFTQQILSRTKVSNEAEAPVDQDAVNSMPEEPTDAAPAVEPETPTDEAPAEETPAEEVPADSADVPAEGPVDGPAEGDDSVEPPAADEASAEENVSPTTDSGEVTADQVDAVIEGNAEGAAEAVAEQDTADGEPTTAEEVIEEVAEQNAAAADSDVIPEPSAPSDDTPAEVALPEDVAPVTEEVETPAEENPSEEPVAGDVTTESPEDVTAGPDIVEVSETTDAVAPEASIDETTDPTQAPVEIAEEVPAVAEAVDADGAVTDAAVGEGDIVPEAATQAPDSGDVIETIDPAGSDIDATEGEGDPSLTEGSEVSNEGFVGGLIGFLAGAATWAPFVGAGVNGAIKAKRISLRKDIEDIAKRIEEIRRGDITNAEKHGLKINRGDREIDWLQIVKSALIGQFFGPFYGARQGSELQRLNNELNAKLQELEKEIEEAGISLESFDESSTSTGCDCEDLTEISDAVIVPVETNDEMEYEQEVLLDATDKYAQVADILEQGVENGGVSLEAMQLIKLMAKHDGVELGTNVSMENYNFTARTQSRIAVEAIGENIVEWIKRFLENFKKHFQGIIAMVKAHFDTVEKARRAIAAIREKLSGGAQSAEGEVSFRQVNHLTIDNSVNGLSNSLGNLVTFSKSFLALIVGHGLTTAAGISSVDVSKEDYKAKIGDLVTKYVQGNVRGILDNVDGGYASKTLPGETKAVCDVNLEGDSENVTGFKFIFRKNEIESPVKEVKALSISEVESVLSKVEELISIVDGTKGKIEDAEKLIANFADSWTSSVDKKDEEGAAVTKAVKEVSKLIGGLAVDPITAMDTYLIQVIVAATSYANASIK